MNVMTADDAIFLYRREKARRERKRQRAEDQVIAQARALLEQQQTVPAYPTRAQRASVKQDKPGTRTCRGKCQKTKRASEFYDRKSVCKACLKARTIAIANGAPRSHRGRPRRMA